jgi:hypothetical protein
VPQAVEKQHRKGAPPSPSALSPSLLACFGFSPHCSVSVCVSQSYKSKQNFIGIPDYTLQRSSYKCKDEAYSHLTCHVFWLERSSQIRFLEVGRGVGAYKADQKRSGEQLAELLGGLDDLDEPAAKKPRHNADEITL